MPETAQIHLSIVVPLFQEAGRVGVFAQTLLNTVQQVAPNFELLLIDDGSTDSTWSEIVALSHSNRQVSGLRLSRNFGKEAALAAGLSQAQGALILTMDGDLQHPPELIPVFLERQRTTGANVVEGVKRVTQAKTWLRRMLNYFFYSAIRVLSGFDVANHTDFKLIDQQVKTSWLQLGERSLFYRGITAWMGFHHEIITFDVPEYEHRFSRFSWRELLRLATGGITAFSNIPLYLSFFVGILATVGAALLGLQTLWVWLSGKALSGFATVILIQLVMGGLVLMSLGVIGLYLAHMFEEVKGRPRYLISARTDRH